MAYQVSEIFDSVQGEGYWTGWPSSFIRLQGCTVGCPWCDSGPLADTIFGQYPDGGTRNTWAKGGKRMEVFDILNQVLPSRVVITGGEPTLHNLDELIYGIQSASIYSFIQLETSGQNNFKGSLRPNWITWSPKGNLNYTPSVDIFERCNEVKWVVDSDLKLATVYNTWKMLSVREVDMPVMCLMPEGYPPTHGSRQHALEMVYNLKRLGVTNIFYTDRLQFILKVR